MSNQNSAPRNIQIVRKDPVGWLKLGTLFKTGLHVAISWATGYRIPRREVLAALDQGKEGEFFDYSDYFDNEDNDVWIDFVADLGDGFNATHSIAWLIGRDYLICQQGKPIEQPYPGPRDKERDKEYFKKLKQNSGIGNDARILNAGKITIFGGDLVYPYATQMEYEDRTIGPYYAARPWQKQNNGKHQGRRLFSIPGNHDWYDGLGAFVQRFCQPGRWMGCWEVQQRRSYFAIKLPHNTWIWGVDLATADDFDLPQLEYFKNLAQKNLSKSDEVIVCVPRPAWLDYPDNVEKGTREHSPTRSWESWKKIEEIRRLVEDAGSRVRLMLSGDRHHYSRYETGSGDAKGKTHLITCGGGGAFLTGTAGLPQQVKPAPSLEAERKSVFPRNDETRPGKLVGALKLPWKYWTTCGVLGIVMMLLVWFIETASPDSLLNSRSILSVESAQALCSALRSSPVPVLILGLATIYGFVRFAGSGTKGKTGLAIIVGLTHCAAQFSVAVMLARYVVRVAPILPCDHSCDGMWKAVLTLGGTVILAGLFFGYVLSLYLLATNLLLNLHQRELFSAQAIEDWKAFLRIQVCKDKITIYPVGLERISRKWKSVSDTSERKWTPKPKGWFYWSRKAEKFHVPEGTTCLFNPVPKLKPHLIEKPIDLCRQERTT